VSEDQYEVWMRFSKRLAKRAEKFEKLPGMMPQSIAATLIIVAREAALMAVSPEDAAALDALDLPLGKPKGE
jgi:hypothetical protein